jgi:hypothetical protein
MGDGNQCRPVGRDLIRKGPMVAAATDSMVEMDCRGVGWRAEATVHPYDPSLRLEPGGYFLPGWGTIRRYGLRVFHPPGNFSFACSSLRAGTMMQSSPSFQLTGVATLYFAVN